MNRVYFLIAVLICAMGHLYAQTAKDPLRALFEHAVRPGTPLTNYAVGILPDIYHRNATDTLDGLVRYWARRDHVPEPVFSYLIIERIRNGTFKEELYMHDIDSTAPKNKESIDYYKIRILHYLRSYMQGCNIRSQPKAYFRRDTPATVVEQYANYYDLLQEIANKVCATDTTLSPIADFLINFYACPDSGMLSRLGDRTYKGTRLYDAVLKKGFYNPNGMEHLPTISGPHLQGQTGMWQYMGNIRNVLPVTHPMIGFQLGGRSGKVFYDFDWELHWSTVSPKFNYRRNNKNYALEGNGAGYMGLDMGYEVSRKKRWELDALAGIGYGLFDASGDSISTVTFRTPDVHAGMGGRYYFRHRQFGDHEIFEYLGLAAQYRLLFYNNAGGTPINGQALSITMSIGIYTSGAGVTGREVFTGLGNGLLKAGLKGL